MPRILHRPEAMNLLRKNHHKYLGFHKSSTDSTWSTSSAESSPQDSLEASQRFAARTADAQMSSSLSSSDSYSEFHRYGGSCGKDHRQQPGPFGAEAPPDEWGFFVEFVEPFDEQRLLRDYTGQRRSTSSQLCAIVEK